MNSNIFDGTPTIQYETTPEGYPCQLQTFFSYHTHEKFVSSVPPYILCRPIFYTLKVEVRFVDLPSLEHSLKIGHSTRLTSLDLPLKYYQYKGNPPLPTGDLTGNTIPPFLEEETCMHLGTTHKRTEEWHLPSVSPPCERPLYLPINRPLLTQPHLYNNPRQPPFRPKPSASSNAPTGNMANKASHRQPKSTKSKSKSSRKPIPKFHYQISTNHFPLFPLSAK